MSSEKQNFLLYQLNPLKKLERINLKEQGKKEKYIEDIFVKNLEKIFSNLVLLKSQCYLKNPAEERDCIIDTLAFNKNDNSFLIIEYKREKAVELFYQVREYMECLEESNNQIFFRNRNKLLRLLDYNDLTKKNNKYWEEEEVNWEKTKGLCIVNEVYGRFPQSEMNDEKIKLVKIAFYDNDILHIDIEKIVGWLKTDSQITNSPLRSSRPKTTHNWTISKVIQEWKPNSEIEKILLDFNEWASEIFDSNIPPSGYYINYFWKGYSRPVLFSLVPGKTQIRIYWSFSEVEKVSENLSNMLRKYGLEWSSKAHYGMGNWFFPAIKSGSDLWKLKEFIQQYKNYCGDKPRLY